MKVKLMTRVGLAVFLLRSQRHYGGASLLVTPKNRQSTYVNITKLLGWSQGLGWA